MNWINDQTNKKVQEIRSRFKEALKQISKEPFINYYDFLLIAKQIGFRFQEANHLMSLKNHFIRNKNMIDKRKLVDMLVIHQNFIQNQIQEKLIVKFNLPDHVFDPIQQVTNQDQEYNNETNGNKSQSESWGNSKNEASRIIEEQSQQQKEKIEIIINIKMQEMLKKLNLIQNRIQQKISQFFEINNKGKISAIQFKKGIIKLFGNSQQKIKISEDDIKTLFYLLDSQKNGQLQQNQLNQFNNLNSFANKLRQFYKSRINPILIKNTQFKKSKFKNNIQIFQVKNPSVLQLQKIQQAVLQQQTAINDFRQQLKKNNLRMKPRFGPLKHTYGKKSKNWNSTIQSQKQMIQSGGGEILMQRQRIEKILKASKQKRKQNNNNSHQTIANKLRSLFIHKVILPREKMLEEEKQFENKKFGNNLKAKNNGDPLYIKASK